MTTPQIPAPPATLPPTPEAAAAPTASPISLADLFSTAAKNKKQTAKARSKAQQTAIDQRKIYWPDVADDELWLLDKDAKKRGGFSQVPRTLSMFINIINDIAKRKSGKSIPAGKTYLVLWLHHFSEGLVKIHSEAEAAYEAGYDGQRSVTTFRAHMNLLKQIGFIDYAKGPKGPYQFVLMLNPYKVLNRLRTEKHDGMLLIRPDQLAAIVERAAAIGAREELEV